MMFAQRMGRYPQKLCMVCIWCMHGVHMMFVWCSYDVFFLCYPFFQKNDYTPTWCAYGVRMMCIWCTHMMRWYDVCMMSIWWTYDARTMLYTYTCFGSSFFGGVVARADCSFGFATLVTCACRTHGHTHTYILHAHASSHMHMHNLRQTSAKA